jgi:hypothetical protein
MRDLAAVVATAAIALGVTALFVFVGNDATLMVPPPEAVAEQFTRELAAGRYDRALPQVDRMSSITLATVRVAGENLKAQSGEINQVEGEPGTIAGAHATAKALLTTDRGGRVRLQFRFVRRSGMWKIVDWEQED